MSFMLGKAIRIAAEVHENQQDFGKNAYILHPLRLMFALAWTESEEIMQIAVLHDVIEDSKYTLERLLVEGFSDRVLLALGCLTHNKDDSYENYIKTVATNKDAVLVKLEDLRDNSDITRLKGLRDKDQERMNKYHKAFIYLTTVKNANREIYG